MSSYETDCEVLFNALNNPLRRQIIQLLSQREYSFTEILETMEISSSHLTYHLSCLNELVLKNGRYYRLSYRGKIAWGLMENVLTPRKDDTPVSQANGVLVKLLFSFLIIVLVSSLSIYTQEYHVSRKIIYQGIQDTLFPNLLTLLPYSVPILLRTQKQTRTINHHIKLNRNSLFFGASIGII